MNKKSLSFLSVLLTVVLALSAIPAVPVFAAFDAEKIDHVFMGASDLDVASNGTGKLLTDDQGIPVLRFEAAKASKSGAAMFYPNKTSLGFAQTGDGSFYDYAFYVFRYRTSGNARTSDTINLRGKDHTGVSREKYGGNDQIIKSDEYTIKTVKRDTFLNGSGVQEAPGKNWTDPWITLKIFETPDESGYIDLDFIACFKTEADAKLFIEAYENGTYVRSDASKPSSGAVFTKQNKTLNYTMYTTATDTEIMNVSISETIASMLSLEAEACKAEFINADVPVTDALKTLNITLTKNTLADIAKNDNLSLGFIANTVKLTLPDALLTELAGLNADIVITVSFDGDNVKISVNNGGKDVETANKARIMLNINTGDDTAVTVVNGKTVPLSGIIARKPAVYAKLPATLTYETGKYQPFTDIGNHWAKGYISFVSARSLFNGVTETEFAPNETMTRAMAATVLMRLADETAPAEFTYPYTDVDKAAWFAPAVEWVYLTGIADVKAGTFRPDEPITREELAGFLRGFADYMKIDTNVESATEFKDSASVGTAYADAVKYCTESKIINGYDDGTFKPKNQATRAEVSTMINRLINSTLTENEIDIMNYQNIPFDEDNIVLSFAAMSDIHIDSAAENGAAKNYRNAMEKAYELSTTGELDLVFALGDVTQNTVYDTVGTNEISYFKKHSDNFIKGDTALVFCTGNHDVSGTKNYEEDYTKIFTATQADIDRYYKYDVDMDSVNNYTGNRHAVVNGYHFISVGMNSDFVSYVKPILDELTEKEPNKPVFVGYHDHAADTVYATHYAGSSISDVKELLDQYPQSVYFSGHSHNGLENPRAIWQGNFTAIDTASVRYLDDNSLINFSVKIPVNATHNEVFEIASEAMLVEVDKNNNIRFTAYNTYRGDVIATYTIAAPSEDGTHLLTYTDERKAYSEPPVFPEDAILHLQQNAGNTVKVTFKQAVQSDITWYYIIEFKAEGQNTIKKYVTSRYFDKNGTPEMINFTVGGFESGVTYDVTLTPYDVWDQPGEPLVSQITFD